MTHLEPLWIFSQSDALRARTTTASRSAVSSVHLELSRRGRGSSPATSAPAVTATVLSGQETSPPVQVVHFSEMMYLWSFWGVINLHSLTGSTNQLQASVQQDISPAMGSNHASHALRAPTNLIWDGLFASLAVEDLAPSGRGPAPSMIVKSKVISHFNAAKEGKSAWIICKISPHI